MLLLRKRSNSYFENLLIISYFLNTNISFDIPRKFFRFEKDVPDGCADGEMSQNCYLGLSFFVVQSREKKFEKKQESPFF